MIIQKFDLINEQTSPLFRIMMVHNFTDPTRRNFDNNICAFHIGHGFILTVAHNIKLESQILKTINDNTYQSEILPRLNASQIDIFNRSYLFDPATNKRYINIVNQADIQQLIELYKLLNFDTRWLTLMQRGLCNPFLIIQFRNDQFYDDLSLTSNFNANTYFPEPTLGRHTFIIQLELVEAFFNEDISLYRIINTNQNVIDRLPSIEPDFTILDDDQTKMFCIQSSPNGFLGRLMNKAFIEGYIDHHGIFQDRIGGDYIFEGTRYLIKGYFRFGSSGAPYVFFDQKSGSYKVNAIQSEASPIQLSINNNRDGNFQYVNAIASPLVNVENKLKIHIAE
jgi:hypothetical protein